MGNSTLVSRDWWKKEKKNLRSVYPDIPELHEYVTLGKGRNNRIKIVYVNEQNQKKIKKRIMDEMVRWVCKHRQFEIQKKMLYDKLPVADRDRRQLVAFDYSSKEIEDIRDRIDSGMNNHKKRVLEYLDHLIAKRKREEAQEEKHHKVHEKIVSVLNKDVRTIDVGSGQNLL